MFFDNLLFVEMSSLAGGNCTLQRLPSYGAEAQRHEFYNRLLTEYKSKFEVDLFWDILNILLLNERAFSLGRELLLFHEEVVLDPEGQPVHGHRNNHNDH